MSHDPSMAKSFQKLIVILIFIGFSNARFTLPSKKRVFLDPDNLCQEAFEYIQQKYGPHHHLTFWLGYSKNIAGLAEIHEMLTDPIKFNSAFSDCYEQR